jgi:hypothetical protein
MLIRHPSDATPKSNESDRVAKGDQQLATLLRFGEPVLALLVAACVLLVHDVPYLLRTPYWLDEAWVAVSTRAPLGHLSRVTSATPIGWTFLLRLVPGSGQQDQRLLPLLFAGLTVLAAYGFGRTLRLLPVITGLLAAGAALLVPTMLVRDDLKEYTADAFVTMLALALMSRLEGQWSRRRLVTLCGMLVASAFISHIALFLAAAGLPCLVATQLARRRWVALTDAAVATGATAALLGAIFLVFDRGTQTPALRTYWNAYFLPHTFAAATRYIRVRIHQLLPYFGIGHVSVLVALVILGLAVLAWQGRWATAAMLPTIALGLVVLSALHKYPLLDERTSTFLITAALVVSAIGVAGLVTAIARRVHLAVGTAVAAAAAIAYILTVLPFVGAHPIPLEDARDQVIYVAAHAGPEDVVLVSLGASYGYGYYAPARPQFIKSSGVGFSVTYPASNRSVVLDNRRPIDVRSGMARALALLAGHPAARLWLVMSHVAASEQVAWNAALAKLPVHVIRVAPGTLLRYTTASG